MNEEHSYGIIPLRFSQGHRSVFLLQLKKGHWGFPKGHAEGDETPLEAARRELFEETGLQVKRLLMEEPLEERYTFAKEGKNIHKRVLYFIAEVTGVPALQIEEIAQGKWVELEEAEQWITFEEGRKLCRSVIERLS